MRIPDDQKLPVVLGLMDVAANERAKTINSVMLNYDSFCYALLEEYWGVERQKEFEERLYHEQYDHDKQGIMKEYFIRN
jgi:hypothetical protein